MAKVTTTDHWVWHTSTVPANKDEEVELFVRERNGTPPGQKRKPVLMLHGRSIPVLPGFDLRYKTYSWAGALAQAGYDVFLMDLQGSGLSARPKMGDPHNVNPGQQNLLTPRPPGFTPGEPLNYPYQLNNSYSDRDELHTVVKFIRKLCEVDKVAFIGWSAAAFWMGPYAVKNPDKVESLFLLAPIFPAKGTSDPPASLPTPGFPTNLSTKQGLNQGWAGEVHCDGQREEGIVDVVWDALLKSDPVGSVWGSIDGLSRYRSFARWGWNETTAAQGGVLGGSVPVLLVYGEHDKQANTKPPSPNPELNFSVPALYNSVAGDHKLMVKLDCAGHSVPWEIQHGNVHELSKHWLKHLKVDGKTHGVFDMDLDGNLSPVS
ncbi:alpha/beta hydrolase [Streptomyces tanashiensis]|uniref:alpha/beta hydrolase n=1 Tax=Streptomyces tanashiensis TaxID=67367 RepID=UPI00344AD6B8